MLTENQYQGKWQEIKGGLRNLWGRLTDDELDRVRGDIYEVTGIVEDKYGETKEEIRDKLDHLMESFDNPTDKNLEPDISSYHRSPLGDEDQENVSFTQDAAPNIPDRRRKETPSRTGFGVGTGTTDAQDASLKDKHFDNRGFFSDRNARH